MLDEPFEQGKQAYIDGKSLEDNPYPYKTPKPHSPYEDGNTFYDTDIYKHQRWVVGFGLAKHHNEAFVAKDGILRWLAFDQEEED